MMPYQCAVDIPFWSFSSVWKRDYLLAAAICESNFVWVGGILHVNQLVVEKNRVIFTLTCYLVQPHFLHFNGNEIPLSGAKKCLTAVGAGSYIDLKELDYLNSWFSYTSESMATCKQAFFFGDEEKSLWEALFPSLPRRRFQGFVARFFPTKQQPLPLRGEGARDEALRVSTWKAK